MRRFIINVNGKSYDVAVEEVAADANVSVAAPTPVAAALARHLCLRQLLLKKRHPHLHRQRLWQ